QPGRWTEHHCSWKPASQGCSQPETSVTARSSASHQPSEKAPPQSNSSTNTFTTRHRLAVDTPGYAPPDQLITSTPYTPGPPSDAGPEVAVESGAGSATDWQMPSCSQTRRNALAVYSVNSIGRRNTSIWRCAYGTAKRVGGGRDGTSTDALAGTAAGLAARAQAAFLGGGRAGAEKRGCWRCRRRVACGRDAPVP